MDPVGPVTLLGPYPSAFDEPSKCGSCPAGRDGSPPRPEVHISVRRVRLVEHECKLVVAEQGFEPRPTAPKTRMRQKLPNLPAPIWQATPASAEEESDS